MDDLSTRFGSGQSVQRIEDDSLLKGQGRFTDDLTDDADYPDCARLCFLRSPYAHARIVAINKSAAQGMQGVLGVYDGEDLIAAGVKPIGGPAGFTRPDGAPCASPVRRILASQRVRYVGEPVVAVVAKTLQQARDAIEAVQVDYEELPAVVELADAMAEGAPALCEAAPDNICAEARYGDAVHAEQAFAKARHVVALDLKNQRLSALSIEPRSILALLDPSDGRLTLRMSAQMPSGIKNSLCNDILGIPRDQLRVTVGDVGGGFGMKSGIHPEEAVTAWCCLNLKRPVKWIG